MRLQPITQPGYTTDVEFLASKKNLVTKAVTLDADLFRTGQYEADYKIAKAATVLGKVTATGLYGPCKKTTLAQAALSTDTTITVEDARFFQAGDEIDVNGTTATISSIDYDTNVITLSAQIGAAKNTGDTVMATDGTGTADCILLNTIDLTDGDAAAAALTQAVVREARIPAVNSLIKSDLSRVEFR